MVRSPEGEAPRHNALVVVLEGNIHRAAVGLEVGPEDLDILQGVGSNHQTLHSSR